MTPAPDAADLPANDEVGAARKRKQRTHALGGERNLAEVAVHAHALEGDHVGHAVAEKGVEGE